MDVKVKGFTAGFLKTTLLLLAALAALLLFGASTARAEEGQPVYGLYRSDNLVYACDATGNLENPDAPKQIGNSTVTNLFVEEGVTKIENNAFQNCAALKEVKLASTVEEIGFRAFYESGLSSINLPEGLETIGGSTFENCASLTTVRLPSTLTSIGEYAFRNSGLKEISLPEGLKTVGDSIFEYCASLTTISLPEGLETIGDHAFDNCTSLTTIRLPSTLTGIGDGTFRNCRLTEISLPEGLETIGNFTFEYCVSLTTIRLPSKVTSIGDETFKDSGLKEISLPEDLETIGRSTFENCASLTTIRLPSKVTSIGKNTFGNSGLKEISLPEGVTKIGIDAFSYCKELTAITLPSTLEEIGGGAFKGSGLSAIDLPAGVTSLPGAVFSKCQSLKKVTFPSNFESLRSEYFYPGYSEGSFVDCSSLSRIVLSGANPPTVSTDTFDGLPSPCYVELVDDAAASGQYDAWCEKYGFTKTIDLGTEVTISTPQPQTYTYTGKAIEPPIRITDTDAGTEGVDYEITYKDNTNAGTATATITSEGCYGMYSGSASRTFTIAPAESFISITPEAGKEIRVGAPITLNIAVKGVEDEKPKGTVEILGKTLTLKDGQASIVYTPTDNQKKDIKAVYTPAAQENYHSSETSITLTASTSESALIVQADKPQFTYGEAITLTVNVGLKPQSRNFFRAAADTVDFYLGDPADGKRMATADVENGKAIATIEKSNPHYPSAGRAAITVVYNGSGSLNESSASISLDIAPAAGTAQVSLDSWTYGQPENTPVPVSETNGTADVTYAYKAKDAADDTYQAAVPTAAGQYTVQASFGAVQNYAAVTATADFIIEKAQPVMTITPEAEKEIQVGDPITLNITVKGVKEETPEGTVDILGKTLTLRDGQTSIVYTPTDTKPVTLTAAYTPAEGENYTSTEAVTTLTVNKAKITGVTFEDAAFTEDGKEHKIELTGQLPEGTAVTYENNIQSAPGVYTAKARIDGGANYENLELSATLTITAKPVDPDQPDTPETPDTPDVPDTPETPDTPDTPEIPDTPNVPDTPGTPEEGGQPAPVPEAGDTATHAESTLVTSAGSGSVDNIRTGLTQTGSASSAAILLSLTALAGLYVWKKKRKN